MWTSNRAQIATMKVKTSKAIMPESPTIERSIPAAMGENMFEADWARESIPLALPYCSFGSIMVTAAE